MLFQHASRLSRIIFPISSCRSALVWNTSPGRCRQGSHLHIAKYCSRLKLPCRSLPQISEWSIFISQFTNSWYLGRTWYLFCFRSYCCDISKQTADCSFQNSRSTRAFSVVAGKRVRVGHNVSFSDLPKAWPVTDTNYPDLLHQLNKKHF